MKSITTKLLTLAVLVALNVFVLNPTSVAGAARQTCGEGTRACGDLTKNGTCCWTDSQKCCWVAPDKGSCYCVLKTDSCN